MDIPIPAIPGMPRCIAPDPRRAQPHSPYDCAEVTSAADLLVCYHSCATRFPDHGKSFNPSSRAQQVEASALLRWTLPPAGSTPCALPHRNTVGGPGALLPNSGHRSGRSHQRGIPGEFQFISHQLADGPIYRLLSSRNTACHQRFVRLTNCRRHVDLRNSAANGLQDI